MELQQIIENSKKPTLYEQGNSIMWTDPYISEQLLEVHLNEQIDLASRKPGTIRKTVDWILSQTSGKQLNILDLGCGPGLYAELYAKKGHKVTGVDFSENSIKYARKTATEKKLRIDYNQGDYLKLDLPENQFDLVTLIYTDFGPLLPEERDQLLKIIRKVLKPGGLFVFDVLNDSDFKSKLSPKSWEATEEGFWKNSPYLHLSDSFVYENEKVILYQHIVLDENDNVSVYRFWNHFFANSDLSEILEKQKFIDVAFHNNIIPSGDGYQSNDVTFCIAQNTE